MASGARSALVTVVLLQLWSLGSCTREKSFCTSTLSRPTCPDLPTFDKIQIPSYGGRWFEIGSTANFKNLQEAGGVCVLADYSLIQPPAPGKGAIVGVRNRIFSLGLPYNQSIAFISITAGQVCSQARNICSQVISFAEAVAEIDNVVHEIHNTYAREAESLKKARAAIRPLLRDIDDWLSSLAADVRELQVMNSRISQGKRDVSPLLREVSFVNFTTTRIGRSLVYLSTPRRDIARVADKLSNAGNDPLAMRTALQLRRVVQSLETGEAAVKQELAEIQSLLARVFGASAAFQAPADAGRSKSYGGISGTAVQNASFAGKLQVTFPGFASGAYWVLALEGEASEGYEASLVYGCDPAESGIEETLFILSRKPTLSPDVVKRLLQTAATLGVSAECSNPFIFTVQSDQCMYPPLPVGSSL